MQTIRGTIERTVIAGEAVEALSGRSAPIHDAATGAEIALVPYAEVLDVDRAVSAAHRALADGR